MQTNWKKFKENLLIFLYECTIGIVTFIFGAVLLLLSLVVFLYYIF